MPLLYYKRGYLYSCMEMLYTVGGEDMASLEILAKS